MKPLFLCLALLLASGSALSASPTLTISTNNTPMDRRALEDLSREVFRRLGVGYQVVSLPSERSLQSADHGEVDGEGLRVAGLSSQYSNLVQVPERYISVSFVAFAHRDAKIELGQGWESLKPYRVAFITGWKMFEANAAGARAVTKVTAAEQMFRMLQSRRIDLALYTRADGYALVQSLGLAGVAAIEPALRDVDLYLYLHRRHEALVPQIAQSLRDMKRDGSHARIMAALAVQ